MSAKPPVSHFLSLSFFPQQGSHKHNTMLKVTTPARNRLLAPRSVVNPTTASQLRPAAAVAAAARPLTTNALHAHRSRAESSKKPATTPGQNRSYASYPPPGGMGPGGFGGMRFPGGMNMGGGDDQGKGETLKKYVRSRASFLPL